MSEETFIAVVSAVHAMLALVAGVHMYRCVAKSDCMRAEEDDNV